MAMQIKQQTRKRLSKKHLLIHMLSAKRSSRFHVKNTDVNMLYNKIVLHPVPTALQTAQYKHSLSALTYALVKMCERNRCATASPYVSSTKTDFRGTGFIFKGSRLLKMTFTLPTRFPL